MSVTDTKPSDLVVSTLDNHMRGVVDQLCLTHPLYDWMRMQATSQNGGPNCTVQMRIGINNQGGYYDGYETLKCKPFENLTRAEQTWKQHYTCFSVCGYEECVNRGSFQIVDLLKERAEATVLGFAEQMTHDLIHGDGVSAITGLDQIINSMSPLHGIDPATCDTWRANVDDGGFAEWQAANPQLPSDQFPGKVLTIQDMSNMIYELKRCSGNANQLAIFVGRKLGLALQNMLKGIALTNLSTLDNGKINIGTSDICIDDVPVIIEDRIPEGCVYFINGAYLDWKYCHDRFFKRQEIHRLPSEDAYRVNYLSIFNLMTSLRRAHGKLTCRIPCE